MSSSIKLLQHLSVLHRFNNSIQTVQIVHHSTLQYITVYHGTLKYFTVHHSTSQHITVLHVSTKKMPNIHMRQWLHEGPVQKTAELMIQTCLTRTYLYVMLQNKYYWTTRESADER